MGNLGSGELLVILILGLLVLGPSRLGVVVQQVGRVIGQVRRVAGGFQEELRDLVEDPSIEALARERGLRATGGQFSKGGPLDGRPADGGSADGGSADGGSADGGSADYGETLSGG
jgi:Tat protein translocase TatB subunit